MNIMLNVLDWLLKVLEIDAEIWLVETQQYVIFQV